MYYVYMLAIETKRIQTRSTPQNAATVRCTFALSSDRPPGTTPYSKALSDVTGTVKFFSLDMIVPHLRNSILCSREKRRPHPTVRILAIL